MTPNQWQTVLDLVTGQSTSDPVVGFIIDSPWMPGWYGVSNIQYYSSGKTWFDANIKAIETFPESIFLPGFWSEFGMCTEPSAFGSRMVWYESSLPHADRVITSIDEIKDLRKPDPRTDGLLPFVIQRLNEYQNRIHSAGHEIKFSIARGPLNIASFLMGTSEFMMAMMMHPEECHRLLRIITEFTIDWLQFQKETFPETEGILILDDIVGFIDDQACKDFAIPYLKDIFSAFDSKIRFFHNDANGLISTPYLKEIGVNLFNFSFEHSMQEIRDLAGSEITLLGNLPPRDVLAAGTPDQVRDGVKDMVHSMKDRSGIIWSCGGGMPQGVTTENINIFIKTVHSLY